MFSVLSKKITRKNKKLFLFEKFVFQASTSVF